MVLDNCAMVSEIHADRWFKLGLANFKEGFAKPRYVVIPNLFRNPRTLYINNKR
jgi:hypothetical protein